MRLESVTQAVSNLALQFGDDDADPGAMVRGGVVVLLGWCSRYRGRVWLLPCSSHILC